jgi:predicted dehydrogenase
MRKIKIVQIGVGHDHALPNFHCVASMTDTFDLAGFVRVEGEEGLKPEFNKGYEHIPELTLEQAFAIPGLEAALIETEDPELVAYAHMAAQKGLHVFMDKPGSQNAEDFEQMLSVILKKQKVFAIGYVYRFHPLVQKTLSQVKEGKLGKLYSVEAHMSRDDKDEKRRWLEKFHGGMTFFLGCHLIDLIHLFMGTPEEITVLNTCTTSEKHKADDLGMAAFRYPEGMSFFKVSAAEPGGFMRRQLVVCGSLGTVEIRPLEEHWEKEAYYCISQSRSAFRTQKDIPLNWDDKGTIETCAPYHRYEAMFADFARRIREDRPSTKEELLREARVHRILLASCGIPCDFKESISL